VRMLEASDESLKKRGSLVYLDHTSQYQPSLLPVAV
jgi:hypothetical protein